VNRLGICAFALVVAGVLITGKAAAQSDLLMKMADNERTAREHRALFSYSSKERSPRTGGHLWDEAVVETPDGVLRRLIAIDDKPLSESQRASEEQRIQKILNDPDAFRKTNLAQESDETNAIKLLALLPKAFILMPDGEQDGCTRVAFTPNPAFVPSSYEERVMTVLAGTVSVKEPENRLCNVDAKVTRQVDFGFGILGRLNSGGHVELTRTQVRGDNWKTSHMSVHIDGRILLLKNLSREQDANRSNIKVLDKPVSLAAATQLTRP
jgi:hypothetical protein